jgi:hypothetical protein
MARSATTPLLAALLVLMLVAGTQAQALGYGITLPPGAVECGRKCAVEVCGVPANLAPTRTSLQMMVSVESCSF